MTGFIKNSGIIPQLAVRIGKTVGLYMITLVDGERSFSYWRDTSAARTLVADLTNLPGIKAGDIAYFSGITLAILSDEDRAKLLGILAAERKKGVKVAFDPNLRPKLWASTDEMRHWIMKAARVADLALPSFEDEATFFDDKDSQATAKRYQRAGVETIVVKDGANPVLIVSGSQRKNVQPGVVDIAVDSTAAGDSFNAAFLVAIESGSDLESGARKACAVAATVISARGALVDM